MVKYHIRSDEALKRGRERRGENDDIGACSTVGECTRVVEGHVGADQKVGIFECRLQCVQEHSTSAVHINMYPFLT